MPSALRAGNPGESSLDKNALASFPRLRGFDVRYDADEAVMADVEKLGANEIRLMLQPNLAGSSDTVAKWQEMLDRLPSQLDAARKHHLYVIVSLFAPPIANYKVLAKDPKAFGHTFWMDPKYCDAMIAQAVEVAKLLKPYEGMVWLELKNEPLDWNDFPNIPRFWPEWSQKIVDAVRAVSDTPLVIQVGPGGLCGGFASFPKLSGKNLVYSVHNYQPHAYTHQGVKQLVGTDLKNAYDKTGVGWPGTFSDGTGGVWDKQRLREELAPAVEFAKKNGARIYVGEFSVARWAPNAEDYLRDNIDLYEEFGWDWTYHAFRESPIWSLEHDENYTDVKLAQRAQGETARGKVIREALAKNQDTAAKPKQ